MLQRREYIVHIGECGLSLIPYKLIQLKIQLEGKNVAKILHPEIYLGKYEHILVSIMHHIK